MTDAPPSALALPDADAAARLAALPGPALVEALVAALLPAPPAMADGSSGHVADPTGDHILNPDFGALVPPGGFKPAAVLVAVNAGAAEPDVVLTLRTATLSSHAGQIAFPGGRIDPGEAAGETALREAFEEIALPPAHVRLSGYLPSYASRTGYRVFPVVGQVEAWPALSPNPAEVAAVFRVPLRFLLDPRHAVRESRVFDGKARSFWSYRFENRVIWGLTAGIIHHMSARVLSQGR